MAQQEARIAAPKIRAAALSAAAARGQAAAVASLLAAGAPPDGTSREPPLPPLHAACLHGHAECAALLLAAGARPGLRDGRGRTAADCAVLGDHASCIGALTDAGYDFDPEFSVDAAEEGAFACLEELHRRGCDPCAAVTRGGTTALAAACRNGRREAAEWLLLHGADPNLRGAGRNGAVGASPIVAALRGGHFGCASLLLDHGATGKGESFYGRPRYEPPALASLVKEHGADVTAAEAFARDALVARVLAAGAEVDGGTVNSDSEDGDSWEPDTPLREAVSNGRTRAVRLLCAHGARMRSPRFATPREQWSALHSAVMAGSLERPVAAGSVYLSHNAACVDESMERGADVRMLVHGLTPHGMGIAVMLEVREELQRLPAAAQQREENWRNHRARATAMAALLARWPLGEPLPPEAGSNPWLPAWAAPIAAQRAQTLRLWRGDAERQRALVAAFLRHVRDACGAAVAPAFAPFARLRFVEGGGLERAWAWERELHRFPVERVALCRAALQVSCDAQAAAAERTVALLRELPPRASSATSPSCLLSREAEKQLYAAARAVGRWAEIGDAVRRAEADLRAADAALEAALEEAEAMQERLKEAAVAAAAAGQGVAAAAGGA